mmetsp:Transcript_36677/g.86274  ORF Transcript_36677/g.86274 Transcript_36677/m.86274 type:complete len:140 (-) Transcript_36677:65-484(-)
MSQHDDAEEKEEDVRNENDEAEEEQGEKDDTRLSAFTSPPNTESNMHDWYPSGVLLCMLSSNLLMEPPKNDSNCSSLVGWMETFRSDWLCCNCTKQCLAGAELSAFSLLFRTLRATVNRFISCSIDMVVSNLFAADPWL